MKKPKTLKIPMTIKQKFHNGDYDLEYGVFIMSSATCDSVICDGVSLTLAMEAGYMADEFLDYLENQQ